MFASPEFDVADKRAQINRTNSSGMNLRKGSIKAGGLDVRNIRKASIMDGGFARGIGGGGGAHMQGGGMDDNKGAAAKRRTSVALTNNPRRDNKIAHRNQDRFDREKRAMNGR